MDLARQSARGSVLLFVGSTISAAAAAVAVILVNRLLGPANTGLLALSLVVPGVLQLLVGFGATVSVTRYCALFISTGEPERAKRFAKNAIVFTLLTGALLAAVGFITAQAVSTYALRRPGLAPDVALMSLLPLGQGLLQSALAAAIGWDSMGIAAGSNASQNLARMALSPLLIVAGFGLAGAIFGYAISYLVAGAICATLLYTSKLAGRTAAKREFLSEVHVMVRFGFPAFVGNALNGVAIYYVSLVLAVFAANATIGYYQAAQNVTLPISLLSMATATALFPAFARLHGVKGNLTAGFRLAVKYTGYVTTPVIFLMAVAARQFMVLLFTGAFSPGADYLVLLSLASAPLLLGLSVIPVFFNGIGKTMVTMYTTGAGFVVLLVAGPLLAVTFGLGVDGLIYATFVSNAVTTGVGLAYFRSQFASGPELRPAVATLVAGLGAAVVAYLVPDFHSMAVALLLKVVAYGAVYLTLAPSLRALDSADYRRAGRALDGLPLVGALANPFIEYQARISELLYQKKTAA